MAFGRIGSIGAGFAHLGASPGGGVSAPAGGALLLTGEATGFAADFTYATDAQRVAVKTAGSIAYSGLSFFTNASASSKWVFNVAGTLVNVAAGSLAVDYDPVTHVANGLWVEPAATNLIIQSAAPATQGVTVTAVAHTLSFFGTGTLTLTGASTAGPLTGTGASNRVSLTFTPTAGTLTLTKSGTVTQAQLEIGTVASSYIPTTVASVTRAMDSIGVLLASIGYSTTAGSWWVYLNNRAVVIDSRVLGSPSLSATPLYIPSSTTFSVFDGTLLNKTVAATVGVHKCAFACLVGDRALAVDGLAVATDAGATTNLLNYTTPIYIGSQGTASSINGYIRQIRYLPRRKSNTELVSETV